MLNGFGVLSLLVKDEAQGEVEERILGIDGNAHFTRVAAFVEQLELELTARKVLP